MKTTIYTVTMNRVFGAIDDLHTFVCKDEAEALVVEWANKNSTEDAPKFYTADEAIDWFSENDSEVEMTIDMHETEVDMASNDDYEMLASENMFMGEFLSKLGYSQDEVSEIANTSMLEKPKQDEITTVVLIKDGFFNEAKSFVSHKDAEAFFKQEILEQEPSISNEDIEACLDSGYWDNKTGFDFYISQNDLVGGTNASCEEMALVHEENGTDFILVGERCYVTVNGLTVLVNKGDDAVTVDVYPINQEDGDPVESITFLYPNAENDPESECQIKTLDDAKALIGERVDVLENDETSEFNGLVIDASCNDIDGILITVIDQDDQSWDIEPKYIVREDADKMENIK